ncbi:MAG: hypothetical protein MHM6MM_006127 [Cercozoa sp. M6MM]
MRLLLGALIAIEGVCAAYFGQGSLVPWQGATGYYAPQYGQQYAQASYTTSCVYCVPGYPPRYYRTWDDVLRHFGLLSGLPCCEATEQPRRMDCGCGNNPCETYGNTGDTGSTKPMMDESPQYPIEPLVKPQNESEPSTPAMAMMHTPLQPDAPRKHNQWPLETPSPLAVGSVQVRFKNKAAHSSAPINTARTPEELFGAVESPNTSEAAAKAPKPHSFWHEYMEQHTTPRIPLMPPVNEASVSSRCSTPLLSEPDTGIVVNTDGRTECEPSRADMLLHLPNSDEPSSSAQAASNNTDNTDGQSSARSQNSRPEEDVDVHIVDRETGELMMQAELRKAFFPSTFQQMEQKQVKQSESESEVETEAESEEEETEAESEEETEAGEAEDAVSEASAQSIASEDSQEVQVTEVDPTQEE